MKKAGFKFTVTVFVILFLVVKGFSQNRDLMINMNIDIDKNRIHVIAELQWTLESITTEDSIRFHWPSNALSQRYHDNGKFSANDNFLKIQNLKMSASDKSIDYVYTGSDEKWMTIPKPSSRKIKYEYTIELPELTEGIGYTNDGLFLRQFYPKGISNIDFDGNGEFLEPKQFIPTDITIEFILPKDYRVFSNGTVSVNDHRVIIHNENIDDINVALVGSEYSVYEKEINTPESHFDLIILTKNEGAKLDLEAVSPVIYREMSRLEKRLGGYPLSSLVVVADESESGKFTSAGWTIKPEVIPEKNAGKTITKWMEEAWPKPTDGLQMNTTFSSVDKKTFGITSIMAKDKTDRRYLRVMAYPAYNDNDEWMAGLIVTNSNLKDVKTFNWAISPMYSFARKRLLGQAWANYNLQVDSETFDKVSFWLGLKSFDLNHIEFRQYTQRYLTIDPRVTLHFKHPRYSNRESSLTLRSVRVSEELPIYKDGLFIGLFKSKSQVHQLVYNWHQNSEVEEIALRGGLEYQNFYSGHYLKMSAEARYGWAYTESQMINLRLFGAGFIDNSARQSLSYQTTLSRSSISLIYEGFNDITYDEYFLARANQSGFYNKQVSPYNGGGFKTPVGSPYGLGMSNNFAMAINMTVDSPFKTRWLPLMAYFDVGLYSVYDNKKFETRQIYNGGLMLSIEDVFNIYVPLIFSRDLKNIYFEKHDSFLSRISFGINLKKLSFSSKTNEI